MRERAAAEGPAVVWNFVMDGHETPDVRKHIWAISQLFEIYILDIA